MATKPKTDITTKNSTGDIEGDDFMQEMMSTLQKSAGIVSSYDSDIESGINNAIDATKKGQAANTKRIESVYDREITYASDAGSRNLTTENESRRGFATNTGILKQIYKDTDKEVKDLTQRREELILAGESDAASKISALEVQSLQFKQEAAQKAYGNLLSLSQFGLGVQTEKRLQKAQTFQEQQAIGGIALEYGLTADPGDTIESIITKAAPFASERQKVQLSKMYQDIAESKARIGQILKDNNAQGASDEDIKNLAFGFVSGNIPELPKLSTTQTAKFGLYAKEARESNLTSAAKNTSFKDKNSFIQEQVQAGFDYETVKKVADANIKEPEKSTYWSDVGAGFTEMFGGGGNSGSGAQNYVKNVMQQGTDQSGSQSALRSFMDRFK